MSANYEAEQKSLISEVDETEELIAKSELNKVDLKVFLREIRKCTDIKELTPTIELNGNKYQMNGIDIL